MVYLFLDADEYLTAQKLGELKAALGDAELAGLNITDLDGPQTDAADLLGQAGMMPFLAPRRLVIVRGYLAHLDKRLAASKSTDSAAHADAAQLLTGLAAPMDTTDLVFIETSLDKRRLLWKGFTYNERPAPGFQDLIQAKHVQLVEAATPDLNQLANWLAQQARERAIPIEPRAVQLLAVYVGANLRQLDNELDKLATYAAGRPITPADIHLLVSDASEAMIWTLTDALTGRRGKEAMQALYHLRRGDANAFYLLTMIARQYRTLIKVKEAMSRPEGRGANEYDIAKLVGEKPFPVKKAMQIVRNFALDDLVDVLDRLVMADFAMKTGSDQEAELDLLIAELSRPRARVGA
jgi:DNA polymerase III subunit delta